MSTSQATVKPDVTGFYDPSTFTITYVVADPESGRCAIIDSVLDYDPKSGRTSTESADRVADFIKTEKLSVEWILDTHVHADHLTAAPYMKEQFGGKIGIGAHVPIVQKTFKKIFNVDGHLPDDGSQFDHLFKEGDTLMIGGIKGTVMETPGHTPACISYLVGDAIFVGDTLFMHDYGTARCDFPGGDARTLYKSIKRIYELPDETRMFLCHDYQPDGRDPIWETTVGEQKARNIHLNAQTTEDEFVEMRTERDKGLDMPVLILPAVQVNMRAGHMPEPEDNGTRYLKIPLNVF
ncbi:MAG: MBL fold metallo-hydrolase [Alphaproteobacteria bacterium]|nr:MBL fold metallo-hydrolase [Alphaproteobacteria bacterium]